MIEKGLEMYFIFVSSKGADLAPISGIGKDSISWCMPSGYEIKSEYHRKISKGRILDLYGFHDDLDKCCSGQDRVGFFHGYLLGDEHPTIMNMDPAKSYYGVYSHGMVSKEDCYFATDEIGLSPLHYSNDEEVLMVSNNPHLIAIYKRMLGIKMRVESTLAVWHAVGITNESNVTGYKGVFRVEPWRYIRIDVDGSILFPAKKRIGEGVSYEDLCYEGITELRKGMMSVNSLFSDKRSQLTGGFDSRLVLSFIMDSGTVGDWQFETKGSMANPDCMVATMLAQRYGLNHNVGPRRDFRDERGDLDAYVKDACMANAMESSLVRLQQFAGLRSSSVCLNGMGAAFAKSFGFASSFRVFMQRKFRGTEIDFDHLNDEQYRAGYDCFGHADADRFYLNEDGLDVVREFRKYLFRFNYNRFQDNMNYADSMSAYRWRIHNCNLSTLENNLVFLYSPVVLEASRKLDYRLRQDGKLYFDMMWRINPDLCFVPFENRVYNPELYREFPDQIKRLFKDIPPVTGSIVSESQITFFDAILPAMKEKLLDGLPSEVFDYVKREAVEERLANNEGFGKPVFALLGLYGVMKWYEIVEELNRSVG